MMNDWQVVPRRATVNGIKFRLHGNGHTLTVYIGSGVRKTIKKYKEKGWCNIFSKGNNLMIQLVCVCDNNSRKLSGNVFSLPYSVVREYWPDGAKEKEISATVEKGNLIMLDLRDFGE